ncbi:MAG: TatD family hydrolase [Candidatus Kaiserbacteria bacterium]|nr:TatD family hydrolase [Candidatus Kaiserbacteria bacterium]
MSARYVDAHCHIQFDQYESDDEVIIERMRQESVAGIVVGCDLDSSRKAVALAAQHTHLYASVGLHPNHAGQESFDDTAYRALITHPKVVAVGECGLDFFRPAEVTEEVQLAQKEVFKKHIALAGELDMPLIIHARPSKGTQDAYHALIEILKEAKETYPGLRGDIHFFVGGLKEAEALIALGFTLSFTAVITFARDYDAVIRAVPLTSILSETDAPYLAPASRRGQRNDPLAVQEVVAKIAEIRGEDLETVRAALLTNARRMFSMS